MKRRRLALVAIATVLTVGTAYYLFAVRCLGRNAHEPPKPYDEARYDVYSAALDNVEGRNLLIQSDTRGLPGFGGDEDSSPTTHAVPLPVEARFQIKKSYRLVSSEKLGVWMNDSPLRPAHTDPAFCEELKSYDKIVVLSPVVFNSDQTSASLTITLMTAACLGNGVRAPEVLRKQCGHWKITQEFPTATYNRW